MIALVLELSGIPSLAFAVGVYLPLSTSLGIFVGGCVRWLVDRVNRPRLVSKGLTEEQILAEGDKSPGVLMASGYIAGGSIAGIGVAIAQGVTTSFNERVETWATTSNPLFEGPNSDLLSILPYAVLVVLLFLAAREKFLSAKA
jgi:Na+-transporting NADH:ubiquinone oxidoreductase subunit NqrE